MNKGLEEVLAEMDNEVINEEESILVDEEKEAERIKKGEELWIAVQQGNTKHLITKIATILNKYPETRNSDVALMIKYWEIFQEHRGGSVSFEKLFELERLTSIARVRAKIQNEYRLFQGDKKVRRFRRDNEEIQKEIQIATKPAVDYISIYADESGKNDEFAIVGSVWILANEGELNSSLVEWSQQRKQEDISFPDEFHFNKLKNNGNNLQTYKDFVNFAISNGHMVGYKAIAVNQTKLNISIDDLNTELFYQLVRIGIEHESESGRIQLPKQVAYFKDKEDGESALRINQIKQSLIDNFKIHYDEKVKLNAFHSLDSKMSRLIQVADLFTAAINRKINHQQKNPEATLNAKDEFADYLFELLNIEVLNYNAEQIAEIADQSKNDLATLYIFD